MLQKKKEKHSPITYMAPYAPFVGMNIALMPKIRRMKKKVEPFDIFTSGPIVKFHGHNFSTNTAASVQGGGGAYHPLDDDLHIFLKNPNKITNFEKGMMSHEVGHKLNMANIGKKTIMGYMGVRQLAQLSSALAPVAVIKAKDENKKAIAVATALPGAATVGEEALASIRGLKLLHKKEGLKTAVKSSGSPIVGLSTYAAMMLAPNLIAYKMTKKNDDKRS